MQLYMFRSYHVKGFRHPDTLNGPSSGEYLGMVTSLFNISKYMNMLRYYCVMSALLNYTSKSGINFSSVCCIMKIKIHKNAEKKQTLIPKIPPSVSDNCIFGQLFLVCSFKLHHTDRVKSEKYLDRKSLDLCICFMKYVF